MPNFVGYVHVSLYGKSKGEKLVGLHFGRLKNIFGPLPLLILSTHKQCILSQVHTYDSIAMFFLQILHPGGIRTRVCCLWGWCDVHWATPPGLSGDFFSNSSCHPAWTLDEQCLHTAGSGLASSVTEFCFENRPLASLNSDEKTFCRRRKKKVCKQRSCDWKLTDLLPISDFVRSDVKKNSGKIYFHLFLVCVLNRGCQVFWYNIPNGGKSIKRPQNIRHHVSTSGIQERFLNFKTSFIDIC
jgi:hypothetical protein